MFPVWPLDHLKQFDDIASIGSLKIVPITMLLGKEPKNITGICDFAIHFSLWKKSSPKANMSDIADILIASTKVVVPDLGYELIKIFMWAISN
jgi:hypothetical protein